MEKTIRDAVIVGSGNLAEALARAVSQSGAERVRIVARNEARGRAVAALAGAEYLSDPHRADDADIYLIAVSDSAVAAAAEQLAVPAGAIVAHTAGSVPLTALPDRFACRAVFYPMQTFTAGRAVEFSEIPIFLELSDPDRMPQLEAFARTLSRTVLRADSAQRARIHLAAVFACNFVNHMYVLGERVARSAGMDFDILKPLVRETADKAFGASSPACVQTGPAVRNDERTLARHGMLLEGDPGLKEIYSLISQSIWETSRRI